VQIIQDDTREKETIERNRLLFEPMLAGGGGGVRWWWDVRGYMPLPSPHGSENPIFVFPEMKQRGLVPNSYIHVSVSDIKYIFPGYVCLFGYSKIYRPIRGM
jgi:hypothetical protein